MNELNWLVVDKIQSVTARLVEPSERISLPLAL